MNGCSVLAGRSQPTIQLLLMAVAVATACALLGCRTLRHEQVDKPLDHSARLTQEGFRTFHIEPEQELASAPPPMLDGIPLGHARSEPWRSSAVQQAIEHTIGSRLSTLGMQPADADPDLHIVYLPFFSSASGEEDAPAHAHRLLIIGYHPAARQQLFTLYGTYHSGQEVTPRLARAITERTFGELEVFSTPARPPLAARIRLLGLRLLGSSDALPDGGLRH